MVDNINLRILKLEYDIPRDLYTRKVFLAEQPKRIIKNITINNKPKKKIPEIRLKKSEVTPPIVLVEQLLSEIYRYSGRRISESDRCTSASVPEVADFGKIRRSDLVPLNEDDLACMIVQLKNRTQQYGTLLIKRLHQRDALKRRGKRLCNHITEVLRRIEGEADMKFSVSPKGGACGWAEWLKAMKLVARLPTGIPPEFRKKLWLTLAEQHLKVKGVDWPTAERNCFSEWTNPEDSELGVQIVKDLHRTGCSLFCGIEGRENQAVLKRVLLAYARWNKAVGYCQGFNMLAALILEVMDRSESDSLKVMIYLIEAVLPEGYFANNLRGLSVDMAVFRDLLKLRLPRLSAHLEKLQKGAAEGSCYEPPLTNVFTMQWFLTLFCNCLPRNTVLRVWDLVFLEGDEILLTTALAIWDTLEDRILVVESADEFYSVMGELARQTLEAPPATSEALLTRAAQLGPVPELPKLRDKHRYNITPWAHSVQSAAKKGLRLFYSEDETDSSDEGDKLALTTAYGLQSSGRGRGALVAAGVFGHPDREKLALDISALKQQYARLRERQRQAHIILAAACARQPSVGVNSGSGPLSVNHLLLGKSAIVSSRGRRLGPPQGAIPPSRAQKPKSASSKVQPQSQSKSDTLHWKDENHKKTLHRRDSIKWKDIKQSTAQSDDAEDDPEEEGKIVPESEINEILQTSMRTRRKSESSSYSECSESSTSTSLCDEPNRLSDFDSEPASLSDNYTADDFKDDIQNENKVTDANYDSNNDSEKTKTEFGNYVQEFKDLLDRTKDIDDAEEKVQVTVDVIDEAPAEVESVFDIEVEPIVAENNVNIDADALSIGDTADMITQDDANSVEMIKSSENLAVETRSEHSFEEFVDSNQGEPLRNYLEEFRKADDAIKREKSVEPETTYLKEISDQIDDTEVYDRYAKFEELKKSLVVESDRIPSKTVEAIEDVKPFVYPDFRSSSCDRSISSSVSSMSPVLRSLTSLAEESPAYICYKSPTRPNSEVGMEIVEDEKPLVLRIDKYFEHSPEFFGARKSGASASSDEEDESYNPRIVKASSLDSAETHKRLWADPFATDIESFEKIIQQEIDEVKRDDDEEPIEIQSPTLSPVQSTIGRSPTRNSEKYTFRMSPTELNPRAHSKDSQDSFGESALKTMPDKSPTEKDDAVRYSILEKTKSEELHIGQKRSFSILDDEIEAIKSQSGRRNSERALRIIQENSKILHRILVNQVNKTGLRDCFQEESVSVEASSEAVNVEEMEKKALRLFEYRTQKTLASPRSASLDESLQRKGKNFSLFSESLDIELKPQTSKETTPIKSEYKPFTKVETPTESCEPSISNRPKSQGFTPTSPKSKEDTKTELFSWEKPDSPIATRSKEKILDSPMEKEDDGPIIFPWERHDSPTTSKSKDLISPVTKEENKSDLFAWKKPDSPIASKSKDAMLTSPVAKEENKTDLFGWENKGFSENQRISSYYKSDYIPPKSYSPASKEDQYFKYEPASKVDSEHIKSTSDNVDSYNLVSPENNSTLTAVSDVVMETSSKRDLTESWKIENNNSLSESYNVSSPYKYTFRSTENSGYIDGVFKGRPKLIDSPLSKLSDTFSKVTECSPLENVKQDARFETSQSSDLCFVSSSMSFSFDPSVDDQQSSKPPTFNSSDTLCQLTSLDQVSTPISPKTLNYSLPKDSVGFSQKELSLELDKFRLNSDDSCGQISDATISSMKSPCSPSQSHDKSHTGKSPEKNYSPFPMKSSYRQPKELGFRLGLYKDPLKSPSK